MSNRQPVTDSLVLRSGGGAGLGLAPSMGSRDLSDADVAEVLL